MSDFPTVGSNPTLSANNKQCLLQKVRILYRLIGLEDSILIVVVNLESFPVDS